MAYFANGRKIIVVVNLKFVVVKLQIIHSFVKCFHAYNLQITHLLISTSRFVSDYKIYDYALCPIRKKETFQDSKQHVEIVCLASQVRRHSQIKQYLKIILIVYLVKYTVVYSAKLLT